MAARPDRQRAPGVFFKPQVIAVVLASLALGLLVGYAVLRWLESTA